MNAMMKDLKDYDKWTLASDLFSKATGDLDTLPECANNGTKKRTDVYSQTSEQRTPQLKKRCENASGEGISAKTVAYGRETYRLKRDCRIR